MGFFIEVMTVVWKTFFEILSVISSTVWENAPTLLEIKKIMECFSPAGIIALYFGVPTSVITIFVWICKNVSKMLDHK